MPRFATLGASLLAASVTLVAPLAHADDPASAQALFTEAKTLMTAGKYADACPKLEESQRLATATGTKFNLADCYEHTGRTASAWAGFLSVASSAKNASQGAREKAARDRAAALEPKLSRLAVVVPAPSRAAGLAVTRDGESVGDAEWGESMPIDPGEHTVEAKAPGKHTWKAIVEVQGVGSVAKVIVPALDDEPVAPPIATPTATATPISTATPTSDTTASSGSSKIPGWIFLGAGAAAIAGGAVTWALRGSTESKLESECGAGGKSCPAGATNDIANGKTYDALGVGLFALGGACVLAGASWLLLAGHSSEHASIGRAAIVPAIGPHSGGVHFEASF
jgi:hypothetical protein